MRERGLEGVIQLEESERCLGLQLSECTVFMSEIVKRTKIKFILKSLKESRIHF